MKLDSLPLLFAADADPFEGRQMTDLEKHDAKYHPRATRMVITASSERPGLVATMPTNWRQSRRRRAKR